jgi:hypothetical protein
MPILKVQVLLHDTGPELGMIRFLSPNATGRFRQHHRFGDVPREHQLVPGGSHGLPAGSVIVYNPITMHCGGANTDASTPKLVLDVMFKEDAATDTEDDTLHRFSTLSRHGDDQHAWDAAWAERETHGETMPTRTPHSAQHDRERSEL